MAWAQLGTALWCTVVHNSVQLGISWYSSVHLDNLVTLVHSWMYLGTVVYIWIHLGTVVYIWIHLGTVVYI